MSEDKNMAYVLEGLEDFDENESTGLPFIKILSPTSNEVDELDMKPGTIINATTKEVYGDKEDKIEFAVLKYFQRFTEWDGSTLVKTCIKGDKVWSNNEPVKPEEVEWIGGNPPTTTAGHCFVVLLKSELKKADPEPMLIEFAKTRFKDGKKFGKMLKKAAIDSGLPISAFVVSIGVKKEESEKHGSKWYSFDVDNAKLKEIKKEATREITRGLFLQLKQQSVTLLEAAKTDIVEDEPVKEMQKAEKAPAKKETKKAEVVEECGEEPEVAYDEPEMDDDEGSPW